LIGIGLTLAQIETGRRAFYPNFSRAVSAWHER
jgi:hypothetical protein